VTKDIREFVRQKYALAITRKVEGSGGSEQSGGCCGAVGGEGDRRGSNISFSCCGGGGSSFGDRLDRMAEAVASKLYRPDDMEGLPPDVVSASFGCGNPTALIELYEGETVLDLGSGAGLDVLLSARRVGPAGKVYGLDMTDEMLAAARANQAQAGVANVEFLKGHIEEIPLPENTVDVVISNCVINLSGDKDQVLKEAYRVLKPGGRFAVADIVLKRPLPQKVKQDLAAWAGCVAGALLDQEYKAKLAASGFIDIAVDIITAYDFPNDAAAALYPALTEAERHEINGSIVSAFVRARKPELI